MYATRSPFCTPIPCKAADQRSQRSKNCSYVRRRSPSTAPSRFPYSLRALRANSRGVNGVSILTSSSRVEHQREVRVLDPAHKRAVGLWLEFDRALVYESVDVVDRPVSVALDPQPVAEAFVLSAALQQVRGAGIDRFQDLQLHAQLGDRLGVAFLLDQLLYLGFEVGDLLLVVVHLK